MQCKLYLYIDCSCELLVDGLFFFFFFFFFFNNSLFLFTCSYGILKSEGKVLEVSCGWLINNFAHRATTPE